MRTRRSRAGLGLFESVAIIALCAVALLAVVTIFGNDRKDAVADGMSGSVRKGKGQDALKDPEEDGPGDHDTSDLSREEELDDGGSGGGSGGSGGASGTSPAPEPEPIPDPEPEPSTDDAGAKALAKAKGELGVTEATGNNDGVPSERYMFGREVPWCAYFVAWAFDETGNTLPGNKWSLGSVQYMEDQMKADGKWTAAGSADPQPGDIIFFKNRGGSDSGPGRHVGIVEKVENGKVYTIEGNRSNGVNRGSYDLDNARISGYGRQTSE